MRLRKWLNKWCVWCAVCLVSALWACRTEECNAPNCRLWYSTDTLRFDTVFTTIGSATKRLMVYNIYEHDIEIERIRFANGAFFRANINGEPTAGGGSDGGSYGGGGSASYGGYGTEVLEGKDSLFIFIRATIDPQKANNPILIRDTLIFEYAAHNRRMADALIVEAYGQDVYLIRSKKGRTEFASGYRFAATKPYLIYDSLLIDGVTVFEPGATLYMHQGAALFSLGTVQAKGEREKPIKIRGDRMDRLFDSVPYRYAAGMWDGWYILDYKETEAAGKVAFRRGIERGEDDDEGVCEGVCERVCEGVLASANGQEKDYCLDYVQIEGGNIGLYMYSEQESDLKTAQISNSRIHNHSLYGLVAHHVDATIANTEISNCASYCLYLDGGKYDIVHTTIASYFGATNVNIQSQHKDDVAAVYINNLEKNSLSTEVSMRNSIVTGTRANQLVLATPFAQYYTGTFVGNFLKTDTLHIPHASGNVYVTAASDTVPVFVNTYYKYKEYRYYDFHLDSLSPARTIGDSLTALQYPYDRDGKDRTASHDAGCYTYSEE